jgi:putative ABC transport system permease protein
MAQTPAAALPFLVNGFSLAARARGEAPQRLAPVLKDAIHARDANVPVSGVRPLSELFDATVAPRRLTAWLTTALAITAWLIGVFGIAAVTAAVVADRRREFAIRLAIGASPARVRTTVLAEVGRVTLAGTALGIVGAMLLHALFTHVFFAAASTRPLGEALAVMIVALAALLGAAGPAWRAAGINAVEALHRD